MDQLENTTRHRACIVAHRIYNTIAMQGIHCYTYNFVYLHSRRIRSLISLGHYRCGRRWCLLGRHDRSLGWSSRMSITQRLRCGRMGQLRRNKILDLRENVHQHIDDFCLVRREDLPSQAALRPFVLEYGVRLGHKDSIRLRVSRSLRPS